MKLSNIAVIFIIIVLPLLLILGYYVSLQIDTINMQTAYNTKLLESTKEAIEAFEINTVEWNESSSSVADSKRRDVVASINTFTTSLANNLGVAGTSKDYMLSRIPAIAYTLYDGYYIYSPAETKQTLKDDKEVVICMSSKLANSTFSLDSTPHVDEDVLREADGVNKYDYDPAENGRVLYVPDDPTDPNQVDGLYCSKNKADGNTVSIQPFTLDVREAKAEDKHILKPFMLYAEQLKNKDGADVVINYTLDNYVTVYTTDEQSAGKYIGKSGYLNEIDKDGGSGENCIKISPDNFKSGYAYKNNIPTEVVLNPIAGITFSDRIVEPEILSETIAYKAYAGGPIITDTFYYVYEAEKDIKAYYDVSGFFVLDNDKNRVYVDSLTEPIYKKCMIPVESSGSSSYVKVYRTLVADEHGQYKWYTRANDERTYELIRDGDSDKIWDELLYHDAHGDGYFDNILYDYSAINYCVETYVYTDWFNNQGFKYEDGTTIKIDNNNDPELNDSTFVTHKKEIIRKLLTQNLEQAITTYSKDGAGDFRLPELKESEWEQLVSNISIVTFLQNIPIGMKYYNNYAIATSTTNKEFVNKNELYFYNRDTATANIAEPIYHAPYCDKYNEANPKLVGYRSIEYIYKYYQEADNPNYYIKHICGDLPTDAGADRKIGESCYYCVVQRALQEEYKVEELFKDAYYTTLARERYLQLESITIQQSKITIHKSVSTHVIDYGGTLTYTITIKNEGELNDTINIVDYYNPNYVATGEKQINVDRASVTCTRTKAGQPSQNVGNMGLLDESEDYLYKDQYQAMGWKGISIEAGEEIKIEYTATIGTPSIGEAIDNTAAVHAYNIAQTFIAQATATTQITKSITIEKANASEPIHVVLVLDSSGSVSIAQARAVREAAKALKQKLKQDFDENVEFSFISFGTSASIIENEDKYIAVANGPTTNYINALSLTASQLRTIGSDKTKYVVFMSDGLPTLLSFNYNDVKDIVAYLTMSGRRYTELTPIEQGIVDLMALGFVLGGGAIETVGGGWYGCIWESESVYKFSLLLTYSLAYPDLGLTRLAWNNIMNKRDEVINELGTNGKMFSVYFNTGFGGSPEYGLYRIASDHGPSEPSDKYAKTANEASLLSIYQQIADTIALENRQTIPLGSMTIVQLEDVSRITEIKIGSNNLDVAAIKAIIMSRPDYNSATDTGWLDLKDDTNIQPYFRYQGNIQITY